MVENWWISYRGKRLRDNFPFVISRSDSFSDRDQKSFDRRLLHVSFILRVDFDRSLFFLIKDFTEIRVSNN